VDNIADIQFIGDMLDSDINDSDNISHFKTSLQTSVIHSPDFFCEEMQFIQKNNNIQNINLKRTVTLPVFESQLKMSFD
jgi:hypothetical protein